MAIMNKMVNRLINGALNSNLAKCISVTPN